MEIKASLGFFEDEITDIVLVLPNGSKDYTAYTGTGVVDYVNITDESCDIYFKKAFGELSETEVLFTKTGSYSIKDTDGNIVLTHTSSKSFNHLAAGTSNFLPTKTYIIYINNEEYERFTISSIVTTVGNSYEIMKKRR